MDRKIIISPVETRVLGQVLYTNPSGLIVKLHGFDISRSSVIISLAEVEPTICEQIMKDRYLLCWVTEQKDGTLTFRDIQPDPNATQRR